MASDPDSPPEPRPAPASSYRQALAHPVFRALWVAVLFGNIGNWMETVGAQWYLVNSQAGPTVIALVQTAATLPVMLLALPAGVLADAFDRRRMLIAMQLFLVCIGVGLTGLAATGALTPALLLLLTLLEGTAGGLIAPAWQASIPDLVDRTELRAAAVLGSVSVNLARAIGPALAGLVVGWIGVASVFALNGLANLTFAVVLAWAGFGGRAHGRRERFLPALRAGGGYVRWSPTTRSIIVRAGLFLVPGVAIWALLPLVASETLHLDAAGYGLLLGALGVGAIAGVALIGRIRARWSDERLIRASSLVYAATMAVLVLAPVLPVALALLLVAGGCWMAVLSTANGMLQEFLPGWVRARGLAVYMMVLFGGQAIGAALWGLVAQRLGLEPAFLIAAVAMACAVVASPRWPIRDVSGLDRSATIAWPEARLAFEPELDAGPVLVRVDYRVPARNVQAFLAAMEPVERSRRRTGAADWGLYRDGAEPDAFVEVFEVATWDEHLRQHEGRLTGSDADAERRVDELLAARSVVRHFFPADLDGFADSASPPPLA